MVKPIFVFLSLFVLPSLLLSQEGDIQIHADPLIEGLVKKQGNVVPPATSPQIPGYRLQLIFDPERKKIDEARELFENLNPLVTSYVVFNAPNYILKAGDFRTPLEAEKLKTLVFSEFPASFVVKEDINLPSVD
jgi:hypothetical protein